MVKTGDTVLYRPPQDTGIDATYRVPAIVQVTHEDWVPGYHNADGDWVATPDVTQPKKGHIHLVYWQVKNGPVTTTGAFDVAEGDGPGCFKERS